MDYKELTKFRIYMIISGICEIASFVLAWFSIVVAILLGLGALILLIIGKISFTNFYNKKFYKTIYLQEEVKYCYAVLYIYILDLILIPFFNLRNGNIILNYAMMIFWVLLFGFFTLSKI